MAQRSRATTDASLAPDVPADTSETERLRAERDHWRHMFDQLAAQFPEPVIVTDDEGRLTHWNREQERFTGTDAADALGRPAHEAIGTENRAETLAETVARTGEAVEIEEQTSHAAADVIFRTLFSIPIEHRIAAEVFHEFRAYQRTQPILNAAAFVPLPRWLPRGHRRRTRAAARRIRGLITELTAARMAEIAEGGAPDDLATKIMTTRDPETGETFTTSEMVDQVAIFFLAGHETSASALAWTLYLMALYPEWQERVAAEAEAHLAPDFACVPRLRVARDVFREALRLYPPVPMMVRKCTSRSSPNCSRP